MKIIHTADIHLGAKINNFPKDVSASRKEEVRKNIKDVDQYTNEVDLLTDKIDELTNKIDLMTDKFQS